MVPFDRSAPFALDAQLPETGRLRPFDHDGMGWLDVLGITIRPEVGEADLNYVSGGLVARETERSIRLSFSDAGAVVPHHALDTCLRHPCAEERYLPKPATGEGIGCFGLTVPNASSDPDGSNV
ncbi:hypothetical protein D2V04_15580 [Pelagerythrobacter aerophilus]|uniref:Uncharacterized protein n=2 Tax=Pelagerythrobacter aerophilus TaxID=2306995 RepID=A0A418ND38_9SPHN|nr:hypothetical protein D2V04_15580 [Pelagerythrobacter aerophilus]